MTGGVRDMRWSGRTNELQPHGEEDHGLPGNAAHQPLKNDELEGTDAENGLDRPTCLLPRHPQGLLTWRALGGVPLGHWEHLEGDEGLPDEAFSWPTHRMPQPTGQTGRKKRELFLLFNVTIRCKMS